MHYQHYYVIFCDDAQLDTNLVNHRKKLMPKCKWMISNFCKKRKRTENSNISSENIQSGHWDGIWHRKMYHASNEKRQTTPDRRNGTAKPKQG